MPEEKKTIELKEEDLEKVSGGGFGTTFHCPECGKYLGNMMKSQYCTNCKKYVTPVKN